MTKEDLLETLIKDGYLKTSAIIEAFKQIDRKDFVAEDMKPGSENSSSRSASDGEAARVSTSWKDLAYENIALPLMAGQTISQPLVVAFMLELLELKPGEKVLDIGTGSGWNTALMAQLVGENGLPGQGKIFSIERIEELYNFAKENLKKYGFPENGTVELILGDGSRGYKDGAPYDKIIAAASAGEIPEAWKEQLKIGGRIVAPVKDSIIVINKSAKDKFEKKEYFGFSFVPLVTP
ncbi:MAG: protein-L-isoaspartate O-methyltransferase [Candidatus Harrisonbacteria bacterium]|nr:protein-L-isoaspartate O-methyltransferase [Candidatus Harrisonbacteria bacterium]